MQVGEKYALKWPRYPHLLDATIVALERDYVVCETLHRCTLGCYLKSMQRTLPLDGRIKYDYHDFAEMFAPVNTEAIPLAGGRS